MRRAASSRSATVSMTAAARRGCATRTARRSRALQRGRDWIWITGNHDPEPADGIGGAFHAALRARRADLPPSAGQRQRGEICRPSASGRRASRIAAARCAAAALPPTTTRMVMPAFGAFTGGLNIRDAAFADLFGTLDVHRAHAGRGPALRLHRQALPAGLITPPCSRRTHAVQKSASRSASLPRRRAGIVRHATSAISVIVDRRESRACRRSGAPAVIATSGRMADAEADRDRRLDAGQVRARIGDVPGAARRLERVDQPVAIEAALLGDGERHRIARQIDRMFAARHPLQPLRPAATPRRRPALRLTSARSSSPRSSSALQRRAQSAAHVEPQGRPRRARKSDSSSASR